VSLKPGVHLRLSQQLALTPQLQQSIRLLQLSSLELNEEVEQALRENPLLEREDDPLGNHLRLSSQGSVVTTTAAEPSSPAHGETGSEGPEASASEDTEYGAGAEEAPEESGQWGLELHGSAPPGDEATERPQDWATAPPSLREHLRLQLASTAVTERDRTLVRMLIDAVDESGYLGVPLEELLELCGVEAQVDAEELLTALRLLQSFDPPGVGARDVAECMRLQLDARLQALTPSAPEAERSELLLARQIVCEHLPLLAARDFGKLRKLLNVDDALLRAAHQRIRGLNPYPGVGFGSSAPDYVIPDILVRRVAGRWAARLNPDVIPRLRVNQAYAAILKTESGKQAATSAKSGEDRLRANSAGAEPGATAPEWSSRLQEARWLIRNLRQRFQTIQRVAQAIVDRQSRFFTYGAIAMRPLVLREIATTLGLHESTISRVTSNKYMATPFGVFELRYFFGSHVATEAGGEASSTAIRALIKQLIEAEDATNPLSDSKLAELLGAQGMVVARRTVAKYRELMQIPTAALRKTI